MKTIERKTSWNLLDRFLSHWRAKFILPYLRRDSVVGDIGCGQKGKILLSISNRIKEGYGFDFNLKSEKHPEKNIFLSNKDFLKSKKKFDVILMLAVLEHLPSAQSTTKMLRGIHSKLNKHGNFIMTTPDKRARGLLEFLAYRLKIINEEEIRDHKHYFNRTELLILLKKAGFHNIRHRYFQLGLNNLIVCQK